MANKQEVRLGQLVSRLSGTHTYMQAGRTCLPASAQNDGLHACVSDEFGHPVCEAGAEPAQPQAVLLVAGLHKVVDLPEVVLPLEDEGVETACDAAG